MSDEKINESEARVIYTKILASMGEKELSSLLTYTNGIIYGIRIDSATGEFIFLPENQKTKMQLQAFKILNLMIKRNNFSKNDKFGRKVSIRCIII